MAGPSARIENHKGNKPRRVSLHRATVAALRNLRAHPTALIAPRYPKRAGTISDKVFPVLGYRHPTSKVSNLFAEIVVRAGLVGESGTHRFTSHDLRRKWNDDFGQAGATIREQMAACGHKSAAVNVEHYQTVSPDRVRALVLGNRALGEIA